MAQMLSPNPTRISQKLPIPKCSTCSQFVPLEELGDHICALPPPIHKPVLVTTSAANADLLPKRFQGRTPSPGQRGSPSPSTSRPPLARETPNTPRPTLHLQTPYSPPRNTPPDQPPQLSARNRGGTPLGYRSPPRGLSVSPSGTQASMLPGITPPRNTGSPSPQKIFPGTTGPGAIISETHAPRQSLVPPPERGIDTKTGGEAGMAGVGRRGFAAVARAAMFALPPGRTLGSQPNQPKYLDIAALSRRKLFLLIF